MIDRAPRLTLGKLRQRPHGVAGDPAAIPPSARVAIVTAAAGLLGAVDGIGQVEGPLGAIVERHLANAADCLRRELVRARVLSVDEAAR